MTSYLLLLLFLLLLQWAVFPVETLLDIRAFHFCSFPTSTKEEVKASPDSNAKKAPPQD